MLQNHRRHHGNHIMCPDIPFPSIDAETPLALLAQCPHYEATPLLQKTINNRHIFIKDERQRMGLGSFKALGAAYVIAQMAHEKPLQDIVFVTASAGNHGLSVAAGAKIFGAKAVIYLADSVPEQFAEKLRSHNAEVIRHGADYEAAMAAAAQSASVHDWVLLSDSSWPGYTSLPHKVMEGYTVMAAEVTQQMTQAPSHIFLQAGVGGMAAASAAYFRHIWGDGPEIFIVEPSAAPALHDAIAKSGFTSTSGPVSCMGRLDCKDASLIALNGLSRDADQFILLDDDAVLNQMDRLTTLGLGTTPSGGAGLVAALSPHLNLPDDARILTILSEGA